MSRAVRIGSVPVPVSSATGGKGSASVPGGGTWASLGVGKPKAAPKTADQKSAPVGGAALPDRGPHQGGSPDTGVNYRRDFYRSPTKLLSTESFTTKVMEGLSVPALNYVYHKATNYSQRTVNSALVLGSLHSPPKPKGLAIGASPEAPAARTPDFLPESVMTELMIYLQRSKKEPRVSEAFSLVPYYLHECLVRAAPAPGVKTPGDLTGTNLKLEAVRLNTEYQSIPNICLQEDLYYSSTVMAMEQRKFPGWIDYSPLNGFPLWCGRVDGIHQGTSTYAHGRVTCGYKTFALVEAGNISDAVAASATGSGPLGATVSRAPVRLRDLKANHDTDALKQAQPQAPKNRALNLFASDTLRNELAEFKIFPMLSVHGHYIEAPTYVPVVPLDLLQPDLTASAGLTGAAALVNGGLPSSGRPVKLVELDYHCGMVDFVNRMFEAMTTNRSPEARGNALKGVILQCLPLESLFRTYSLVRGGVDCRTPLERQLQSDLDPTIPVSVVMARAHTPLWDRIRPFLKWKTKPVPPAQLASAPSAADLQFELHFLHKMVYSDRISDRQVGASPKEISRVSLYEHTLYIVSFPEMTVSVVPGPSTAEISKGRTDRTLTAHLQTLTNSAEPFLSGFAKHLREVDLEEKSRESSNSMINVRAHRKAMAQMIFNAGSDTSRDAVNNPTTYMVSAVASLSGGNRSSAPSSPSKPGAVFSPTTAASIPVSPASPSAVEVAALDRLERRCCLLWDAARPALPHVIALSKLDSFVTVEQGKHRPHHAPKVNVQARRMMWSSYELALSPGTDVGFMACLDKSTQSLILTLTKNWRRIKASSRNSAHFSPVITSGGICIIPGGFVSDLLEEFSSGESSLQGNSQPRANGGEKRSAIFESPPESSRRCREAFSLDVITASGQPPKAAEMPCCLLVSKNQLSCRRCWIDNDLVITPMKEEADSSPLHSNTTAVSSQSWGWRSRFQRQEKKKPVVGIDNPEETRGAGLQSSGNMIFDSLSGSPLGFAKCIPAPSTIGHHGLHGSQWFLTSLAGELQRSAVPLEDVVF